MSSLLGRVLAALGLLVLSPLLLGIALVIATNDGPPVLYHQARVGRGGGTFRIHKFRTMAVGAAGPAYTTLGDLRITGPGKWLRRHRLDELPQLWNVVVGEMALVGPRPEVEEYVELWGPHAEQILSVRPGLTDPATLRFIDEASLLDASEDPDETYRSEILPQKVSSYEAYVRDRSGLGDFRILLRTLWVLLSR